MGAEESPMKIVSWTLGLASLFLVSIGSAQEAVPGEFIVQYRGISTKARALGKTSLSHGLKLVKSWDRINMHQFSSKTAAKSAAAHAQILEDLKSDPNVLYAEPNYIVRAQNISCSSGGYSNTPLNTAVQAIESWGEAKSLANDKVTVAVIDSGLDTNHSFFNGTGRLWTNVAEANGAVGVDDDGNGYIDDVHGWNFVANNGTIVDDSKNADGSPSGHGTHVAGIILGANEDYDNIKRTGLSRVQVMPLKFLDENGVGKTSDAINAIYYALDNGAKVLNNSWGGPGYSRALHEAVVSSFYKGSVFVAAAGNESSNNDQEPIYPASLDVPNLISVGASSDSDDQAFFSNYGRNSVHVNAPGVHIVSSALEGRTASTACKWMSGTSMAAPFVSGLAAMMSREAAHFSGYQIKRDILSSVDTVSSLATLNATSGRINFLSALREIKSRKAEATIYPDYEPNYSYSTRSLASSDGSASAGCGRVQALYKNQNTKMEKGALKVSHVILVASFAFPLLLIGAMRSRLNRRQHQRERVDIDAFLIDKKGNRISVHIDDFSLGGAGISFENLNQDFDLKHEMKLVFKLNQSEEWKTFDCLLASSRDHFMGLSFSGLK